MCSSDQKKTSVHYNKEADFFAKRACSQNTARVTLYNQRFHGIQGRSFWDHKFEKQPGNEEIYANLYEVVPVCKPHLSRPNCNIACYKKVHSYNRLEAWKTVQA